MKVVDDEILSTPAYQPVLGWPCNSAIVSSDECLKFHMSQFVTAPFGLIILVLGWHCNSATVPSDEGLKVCTFSILGWPCNSATV